MSDLLLWGAANIPVWRPFAIALLSLLILACLWWAFAGGWEDR